MTNEIATIDDSQLVPTLPVDPFDTLNRYTDMLAKSLKFAQDICRTSLVPKIYQNKPGDAAVAILHGAEIGLHPLQALQNVFPVHGMPSIYARTAVALLRAKGYTFTTHETGPDKVVLQGWSPNGKQTETSEWTMDRAVKAGFVPTIDPETGKYKTKKFKGSNGEYEKLIGNEKYLTQPEEMLWAKAASTVCRRLASHVLLGLAFAEDQEDRDEPEPVRVTSERMSPVDVASAVTDNEATAGPPVQQWQPPIEADVPASDDVEKPDIPQAETSAQTAAVELASTAQQRTLSDELERHGHKTAAAKRKWLSLDTGREIASAKELSSEEADSIIARLTKREAGNLPILHAQWIHAARMFDQLGADTLDKKLMFLRSFLPGRDLITDPLDLNEREGAEIVAELTALLDSESEDAGRDTVAEAVGPTAVPDAEQAPIPEDRK